MLNNNLSVYKQKRDFTKTPEPTGRKSGVSSRGLQFVVQKHNATQLHFDFRLEVDGTLKSWAVPKGPSLDPSVKRLAIQVEDHPIDYAKFEGIIPKGNYGAGTVKIWDKGVYKPIGTKGLKKGQFEFEMFGKKLQGGFRLTKFTGEEKNWLLVKKPDKKAIAPASVSTKELTNEGISTPIPRDVKPMLASTTNKPFDRENWFFEIKWRGYRTIANVFDHRVKLYSEYDQPLNDTFPEIVDDLTKLSYNVVFDGVVVNENTKSVYSIFDILYVTGKDLRHLPLRKRKEILAKMLSQPSNTIRITEFVETKEKLFSERLSRQHAGIIAKHADSPYRAGIQSEEWQIINTL